MRSYFSRRMLFGLSILAFLIATPLTIPAFGAGGDILGGFGDSPQPGKQEAAASVTDSDGNVIITGYRNVDGGIKDAYYTVKFNTLSSTISWRATLDKSTDSDRATAVAVDSEKNIIVTGYVWNGLNKDIHTVKYDGQSGAVMWEHTFNGNAKGHDVATAVAVDGLDNIYVAGHSQNSDGNNDFLVVKYSTNGPDYEGKPAWQVILDGRVEFPAFPDKAMFVDVVNAIAVDSNHIVVTGYSWNGTDFDYLTGKYSLDGSFIWKKRFTSAGLNSDMAQFVKIDAVGNIIVTGSTSNASDKDITTLKYDSSGTIMWNKTFHGGYNDEPGGLAVDGAGDAYVTGYSFTLTGNKDFYTVKYRDPVSGLTPKTLWEKIFNSSADKADVPSAILLDGVGNVYVTGYTFSGDNYDFQTIKYKNEVGAIEGAQNNDGTELWHENLDGPAMNNDIPVGISLSTAGGVPGVYVSGWSEQLTAGDYDYYVVKYDAGALNPPSDLFAGTPGKDAETGTYSIPLSWVVNSTTEEGFVIERKDPGAPSFVKLTTAPSDPLPPGTTTYTDPGLTEDRYYCYRVKAISASGDSIYSDPLCVLTMIVTPVLPDWDYHYNGRNDSDDFVTGIAVGKDGHPVVTGYSLDFAPGYTDGTVSTDFLTVKLNALDKGLIWSDQFEGGFNQEDDAKGLAVDGNNDVIVTGNSYQDFGGAENINSIYTIKYRAAAPASKLWRGQYNGPSQIDDRVKAVAAAMDSSNSSVIIGHGKNAALNEDIYVVKYASTPALDSKGLALPLWQAIPYDGGGNDYPHAVAFDKDGNIFVTGYRESAPDSNVYDFITAKYCGSGTANPTCNNKNKGEIVWSDTFNGAGNGDDQSRGIAVDANGDVYVTGYSLNNAAPKNVDFLTIKYSGQNGARLWAEPKTFDGDYHGNDRSVAIKVDPVNNHVMVTGTTEIGPDDHDFHTIRYTPGGEVVWQRTHKKLESDDNANAMAMDLSGNIFVVGNTTTGFNTDSSSIAYDYEGNLLGETVYNNVAITNGIDDAVAVTVNNTGEAFVAGYSTNSSSGPNGPNADYLVYKIAGVPLQAPTPFTAGENYTSAILNWADNPGTKLGYDLERKADTCASTEHPWIALPASPLAATATTFIDKGLIEGKSYCYRIRAFAVSGRPTRWVEREIVMENPPPPGSFTATPADTTTVNLAWTDTTDGESHFQIQRCDGELCTFLPAENVKSFTADANATSFVDSSSCQATTYRYRILAYRNNDAGTGIEWDSAYTTISTPVVMPPPNAPGTLTAEPVMESQVKLNWTDTNNDETGYKIYECPAGNCSAVTPADLLGTTAANIKTFTHTGLIPSSTHKYLVRPFKTVPQSCDGGWETAAAESNTVTTSNNPPVLNATKINTTRIDLSWSDPTAAETGYQLQRCKPGAACTGDEQDNVKYDVLLFGSDITSYSDTAVCQNTSYLYRVRPVSEGSFRRKALIAIGGFQPNFQTKITITRADFPGMQSNYADIGLYDDTAKTELPFWIDQSQTNANVATVWFKSGSNNNIYLHYGNSTTSSAGNGAATFEFFDDFLGTTLGNAWVPTITSTATLTVGDGVVTFDAPTRTNATISKGLTPPYRIEARTKVYSTYLGSGLIRVRGLGGLGDTGIFDVGGSKLVAYFNSSNSNQQIPADTYVKWRAAHTGGSTNIWSIYNEDGTQIYSTTYSGNPATINLSAGDAGGGTGKFSVDWVMARKYAATEPTVTSIGTPVDWDSTFSNPWTGVWGTATQGTYPATVPTSATASRVSESEIKITLNYSATDITGIKVDRCTDQYCTEFARNLAVLPGVPTVSDNSGLLPDTTYYYLVHSYKTSTCSWDSKDITPVIVSAATTLMAPTNATANTSISTNCNDLRFADGNGNGLNYWVESGCNSSSTQAWLKFDSLPTGSNTIYAYYANPAAVPQAVDLTTFFDFYDNFTGTTLDTTTKWTKSESCGGATRFTQNDGLFVASGCNTWGYNGLYTKKDFVRPFIIEFSHYYTGGSYAMFGAKNTSTSSTYTNMPYAIHPIYDGNGDRLQVYEDGSDRGNNKKAIARNAWQYYKLEVLTTGANYYHGNTPAGYTNFYTSNYSSASPLKFGIDDYNQAFTLGTVKVRKYASPQPTYDLLPEEPGSYLTDNAWSVRRQIPVTNSSGQTLLAYQMPITLDTTSLASDQVVISWTAGTASEQRYKIERCEGSGCSEISFDSGIQKIIYGQPVTSSYADREVRASTKYCYRVSAERNSLAPIWATAPSGVVCATTSTSPVAPTLTVVEQETSMDLSWNDVGVGENSYLLQRCTGSCDPTTTPDLTVTLAPGTTTFTDTTVCTNSYTYAVKAVKYGPNAWDSGFSIPVTKGTVPPEPPILIGATLIGENQVNLVWQDKTGDETGFKIDRCEGTGCDFTTKTTLMESSHDEIGGIISYSDSGIVPNTTYRYRVMAYKTSTTCGWDSSYSEIQEATTNVAAPTALSGIAANTTTVTLNWLDKTQSDSGFKVERCAVGGSCATPMDFVSLAQPAPKRVFYSFNNTLTDSSGSNLHLSGSTPTYDEGGLALSTTTAFQSGTTSILNNDNHAIEFDFKIRATNSAFTKIFGYTPGTSDRSPGIWLKDGNSPTLYWRYHDSGRANTGVTAHGIDGDSGIPFTVGQWYHVRGTKNGNSFKMYVNGILVSDTIVANPKYAGESVLSFGGADVTIKNFSIDWNESPITITDTSACSDTAYNYRVKAVNTTSHQYDGPYSPAYTIVTPAIGNNLIPANTDFNNGLSNWSIWGIGVSGINSTIFSGMKSLRISATLPSGSQSTGVTQNLKAEDVVEGRSYKLYANIKVNLDKTGTGTTLAFCRLDNTSIGNPDTLGRELQITAGSDWNDKTWHHMPPLDVTLKPGVTSARVMCGIWSSDGQNKTHTAYFTGLQLVPNPVVQLTAARTSEAHVTLSWKDIIPDKSGYRLERCNTETCQDGDFIQIGADMPATTTNFIDVVPAANATYTYRVKAVKTATCNWSVTSNNAAVLTGVTAPVNFTATAVNTTRIDLNWSNNTMTETGFTLERCTGPNATTIRLILSLPQPSPVRVPPVSPTHLSAITPLINIG